MQPIFVRIRTRQGASCSTAVQVQAHAAADYADLAGRMGFAAAMGLFGVAWLYLVKSALGIDLFDGPSFLHDFLYHFIA